MWRGGQRADVYADAVRAEGEKVRVGVATPHTDPTLNVRAARARRAGGFLESERCMLHSCVFKRIRSAITHRAEFQIHPLEGDPFIKNQNTTSHIILGLVSTYFFKEKVK